MCELVVFHEGGTDLVNMDSHYFAIPRNRRSLGPDQSPATHSKLTAVGKDECAIKVFGYVFRGEVKYTDHAFHEVATYKRKSKNHLMDQVESFRVGDKDNKREDDLLDTFCYGIALALGDSRRF
jgi:hypothetical protein